jgi:hypothetical protein
LSRNTNGTGWNTNEPAGNTNGSRRNTDGTRPDRPEGWKRAFLVKRKPSSRGGVSAERRYLEVEGWKCGFLPKAATLDFGGKRPI